MAHTRTVTGPTHTVEGDPAALYRYVFAVKPGTVTAHAIISPSPVIVTADEAGVFAADLEVGISIIVTEYAPTIREGRAPRYTKGATYTIVVPEGDTPISIMTIRAGAITDPGDPTLPNMVAQVASDLSDHEGDTDNPHGVTAHQTGTYTSGEIDNALALKLDADAVPDALTDLDTTVTGAQLDALKQAADLHGDIVTHDADEFATAAQGEKADTALQPDALAPYETTTQLNSRDTANRDRANHTGTQTASTISDFAAAADARIDAQKTEPDGLATLDAAGHVPTDQLPPLAITEVHVVADEAAMLALDAQAGDMAIREDSSRAYVHNGGTAGTVADWIMLAVPPDAVLSVNGKTGTVSLVKGDVGLGNVDNTSDADKPISTATQAALDGKLPTADAPELIRDTMGTALVAGDNITITPDDAGDTITVAGGDRHRAPLISNSLWLQRWSTHSHSPFGSVGDATLALIADHIYFAPIDVPRNVTSITSVEIWVTVAGGGGSLVRLGVFRNTTPDGQPTLALLSDVGTVAVDGTGIQAVAGSVDVSGLDQVYIGALPSASVTIRAVTLAGGFAHQTNVLTSTKYGTFMREQAFEEFAPSYGGFRGDSNMIQHAPLWILGGIA